MAGLDPAIRARTAIVKNAGWYSEKLREDGRVRHA
jgi:hypothetical protein